ncbi:Eco57I restriction-modification methylase domain-containing protein [Serpentinicella alkaliphila]|uniref:site-specific DNA-methyltransferase (adenine-specific) n=1 Tax=Serpentinicella alkaliphila TaxID=1734049 RepID=A0A4V2T595_9FIRM|nr:TaqI-like C-terminal specificity domain-containing protein [Serpentinicella alkaliphila]QUH26930.1 Eco57I restriction-modification methylase domain-containing protein [Serpentinicella alkaliphila]TCQ08164.1 adenine-specific DNA-methyltransferase [Serpentinicella alkaliphila]
MVNVFKDSCNDLTDKLVGQYGLTKVDSLIWIYLNLYMYKNIDKKVCCDKFEFIYFLNNSRNFSGYLSVFESIDDEYYKNIHETILRKLSFNFKDYIHCNISLKDMEEVYESFLQEEIKNKTGSYYTPIPIVKFITKKSIIEYLKSQLNEINIPIESFLDNKNLSIHIEDVMNVISTLEQIKIIDIACGGGVFLREAVGQIYNMLTICYDYLGIPYEREDLISSILSNNIFGIDIQRASVDICKLLLLMGTSLEVELNITTGNALYLNSEVKYDIVLGNPPYIGEKGNRAIFESIRNEEFGIKYYEKGMDYFYFFIYKAAEILKDKGVLGYITTNYFVTADSGKKLREFMKDNFQFTWLINFDEINIFQNAKGQHNLIYIANKSKLQKQVKLFSLKDENFKLNNFDTYLKDTIERKDNREYKVLNNRELYTNRGHILIQCDNELGLLNKIEDNSNFLLRELCNVNQGIVSGADKDSKTGKGIFVLTREELEELNLLKDKYIKFIKPFYKNSQIKKYLTIEKDDLFILYIDDDSLSTEEEYPHLIAHLSKYKTILLKRREVQKGTRKWYALQWPRNINIFEEEKIVSPQRSLDNSFAYSMEPLYASADVYYITKKTSDVSLIYILGILNSSLMYYYLFNRGKRKGKYLELYATPLKELPIVYTKDKNKISLLENYVKELLNSNIDSTSKENMESNIDNLVFELYKTTSIDRKEILSFKKPK